MKETHDAGSIPRPAIRRRRSAAAAALLVLLAGAPAAGAPGATRAAESAWVEVSYRELLDPEALTRSGEKLVDAMHRKAASGEIQPFLDPYTSLLGYAVQMLYGTDAVPQTSLAERYPVGTAQPAWVAILREGKYFVSADGQGRARVFVPGDDPRTAYRRSYSLLRHPLAAALVPGAPLQVEVFSYRNDFAAAELRLNPAPYRFRARAFPSPGRPLDLDGLAAFFRKGGQLEGAELSPDGGLVLYASQTRQLSLGGKPVSLEDLAVAYRAVSYAGDAEAFVSLDGSADPTQATVNFGGLLEDTRIGKAVLAADVRFKTICSGLDPVTHADIREQIRAIVPSFMSNSERLFLSDPKTALEGTGIMARYWYYPDSCGVETDEGDQLAAIMSAQLTADVERMDIGARADGRRKTPIFRAFRENIRELNDNYSRYAAAFPEYQDLSSAARLMAIAAWLGRARPKWLDLDGLLAVTLPSERTPRTVPQHLTAEILNLAGASSPDREYVLRNTRIHYLTPELDKKVSEFFGDPRHLAMFLAFKAGKDAAGASEFTTAAERLFPTVQDKRVRDLLRSVGDLQAFLRSATNRLMVELSAVRQGESDRDGHRLQEIRGEIEALHSGPAGRRDHDKRRARLEEERREIIRRTHVRIAGPSAIVATQYTGGVSLAPKLFTVKRTAKRPALEKLELASRTAGTTWGASGWIRSTERPLAPAPAKPAGLATPTASKAPARPHGPATAKPDTQALAAEASEEIASAPAAAQPAIKSIAVPESASPAGASLVGRVAEGGRIVFTRAMR